MRDDRTLIEFSALHDGEIDAARADFKEMLASDADLRREMEIYACLDRAAAGLPVPQRDKELAAAWNVVALAADADIRDDLEKAAAAATKVPQISAERFAKVWQKIAEQTVQPTQRVRDAIALSALADGELQGSERSNAEAFLQQNKDGAREQQLWKKLDAAAAALPAPQIEDVASRQAWNAIAEQTVHVSRNDRRDFARLESIARELPVPVPGEQAFESVWKNVALRRSAAQDSESANDAPKIGAERWGAVWQNISSRVNPAQKQAAAPAAPAKVVPVDFRRQRPRRIWPLAVAASIAAAAIVSVIGFLKFDHGIEPEVAVRVPEVLDQRYNVQTQYIAGQEEPVVCFFLNEEKKDEKALQNFQWLPD